MSLQHRNNRSGRPTWQRRLAMEQCEDRIALSATTQVEEGPISLTFNSRGEFILAGQSFALFDADGFHLATLRYGTNSNAMIVDSTGTFTAIHPSGIAFGDDGNLSLDFNGVPLTSSEKWPPIAMPTKLPNEVGALISLPPSGAALPTNDPESQEPIAGQEETFDAARNTGQLEPRFSTDQPIQDRPSDSAVFFEVATTTRQVPPQELLSHSPTFARSPESTDTPLAAAAEASVEATADITLDDSMRSEVSLQPQHDVAITIPVEAVVANTTNIREDSAGTIASALEINAAGASLEGSEANRRDAAFAEWQPPQYMPTSRYSQQLFAATIAIIAATDCYMTRKSSQNDKSRAGKPQSQLPRDFDSKT